MNVMNVIAKNPVAQVLGKIVKCVMVKGIGAVCKQIHDLVVKDKVDKLLANKNKSMDIKAPALNLGTLADYGYNDDGTLSHSMALALEQAKYLIAEKLGETLVPME